MRYLEATRSLYALSGRGMRLGLGRMRRACAQRGHPERSLPWVHVAGTNGKGSVVTLLSAMLSKAGYRVGTFTSPHLHSYTERFRIDGEPVSRRQLSRRIQELLSYLEGSSAVPLTFFEASTLLALELFRDVGCDVGVLEVGLGGRLDSTNVVTPELSVLTHIGRDHSERLGRTLAAIAFEKAGIVKPGVPVVVGARSASARRVIAEKANQCAAPVWWLGKDFSSQVESTGRLTVQVGATQIGGLRPSLKGKHQWDHVATACAGVSALSARGFKVPVRAIRRGVASASWPGRLEWLPGTPRVLLDAAHNPDGARALAEYVRENVNVRGPIVLLFGAMADKELAPMLRALRAVVHCCVWTRPQGGRSWEPSAWSKQGEWVELLPRRALARARSLAGSDGCVVVAGSIFLMAEVRAAHLGLAREPAIRL